MRVIETGGHSLGHQIVVGHAGGDVVIPGDEVYLYANLTRTSRSATTTTSIECRAQWTSCAIGGHLLPAHDAEVLRRYPSGAVE